MRRKANDAIGAAPGVTTDRRQVLLALTLFAACGCRDVVAQDRVGCFLSRSARANVPGRGRIADSAGLIKPFASEIGKLNRAFKVRPYFDFYDDGDDENAYATNEVANADHPDGQVLFGRNLFARLQRVHRSAVIATLSHEWAHIRQYKSARSQDWSVLDELSADYLTGWYYRTTGKSAADGEVAKASFSDIGDVEYAEEDHHGTPRQRAGVFELGFQIAGTLEEALTASYRWG